MLKKLGRGRPIGGFRSEAELEKVLSVLGEDIWDSVQLGK